MKRAYSNNLFETGNTIIPKTMKNLGLLKEYKKNQIFYKWGYIVGKEIEKHIPRRTIVPDWYPEYGSRFERQGRGKFKSISTEDLETLFKGYCNLEPNLRFNVFMESDICKNVIKVNVHGYRILYRVNHMLVT